ncbi:MAG: DUF4115 domain-containing protein [Methylophilaceae bacterium]|nr:DUF4115 domain-containing protein [Methylophilaceae bacterium]
MEPDADSLDARPGFGAQLRAARERLGLDVKDLALQLKLSVRQLEALEAEDLEALPSPAFTRGFIRNYARLLQLDAEPLLALYHDMVKDVETKAPITLQSENIPIQPTTPKNWMPYLIASAVLGIAVGGWWVYLNSSDSAPAAPAATAAAPPQKATAPVASAAPVAQSPSTTLTESDSASQPAQATTPTMPAVEQTQAAAGGGVWGERARIVMTFSQPTWVRVMDRGGVEVLHKNKPAGSEEVVEGNPPFRLEIGNAAGVQLNYNGQPIDLTPHTKANVARLTLE